MYRYELQLTSVVDVRPPEHRDALGLSDGALVDDDLRRCQAVGEAAHHLGREAIFAPSAAGPGTVLAVFIELLKPESFVHDVDFELWEAPPDR